MGLGYQGVSIFQKNLIYRRYGYAISNTFPPFIGNQLKGTELLFKLIKWKAYRPEFVQFSDGMVLISNSHFMQNTNFYFLMLINSTSCPNISFVSLGPPHRWLVTKEIRCTISVIKLIALIYRTEGLPSSLRVKFQKLRQLINKRLL